MSEKFIPKFSEEAVRLIKSEVDPVKRDLVEVIRKVENLIPEVV